MPFQSRRQQRWAFANKKPFANRWAKQTNYAALPEQKDAGAVAGAQLGGPGGLMATPGVGGRSRRWGKRRRAMGITTKPMTRSEAARVAALARWGKSMPKLPPPPKGRKPAKGRAAPKGRTPPKTAEERAIEHQQAQAERDRAKQAQRTQNRADVLRTLNIAPDGQQALEALRSGQQPDANALARGGFVQAGLVEQAADGSYRMTPAGRALLSAADAGDRGRAGDTISGARDRTSSRTQRQQAAAERRRQAAARRAARAAKKPRAAHAKKPKAPKAPKAAKPTRGRVTRRGVPLPPRDTTGGRGTLPPPRQTTKAADPGDYLIVEDRAKPSTYHLQVKKNGTPDHGLMGSAWAALHGGFRGNVYQGPQKAEAISKLRTLYEREGMAVPSEKAYQPSPQIQSVLGMAVPGVMASSLSTTSMVNTDRHLKQRTDSLSRGAFQRTQTRPHVGQGNSHAAVPKYDAATRAAVLIDGIVPPPVPSISRQSFVVFKDDTDAYRWVARTSTAYRDRDGEIVTTKALEADAARMTASGQYGPLRYWHIGQPDPFDLAAPWGPGLDIGDCDYSIVIGRTAIESGTFTSHAIGRALAETAGDYELSRGFMHPPDQPNAAGEFDAIHSFERSIVPTRFGRASNLFTGMTVKESSMDDATYKARVDAFLKDMNAKGVPEQVAAGALAGMEQADKSAAARGIAYKTDDAPLVYLAPDGQPGMIVDGRFVALKAAPPMDAEDDPAMGGDMGVDEAAEGEPPLDGQDQGGEYIGDMTPAEFWGQLQQYLAPVLKMQELHKSMTDMMGGMKDAYATKDAGHAAEIAALKAEQTRIASRLATLAGDQPAVVQAADVAAALKSDGPQAPPDPTKPQLPDPSARPFASLAAVAFPELYGIQPPNGQPS